MTEVDLDQWPGLTDAQQSYISFVAERADTDIPDTNYTVGTYEFSEDSIELLAKYAVFRLYMPDGKLQAAAIMFLAHDKTLITYTSFEPDYWLEEGDISDDPDSPFLTGVGDYGDDSYLETDEQMQKRLDKLAMLEQSGILKRIVTDPKDHA